MTPADAVKFILPETVLVITALGILMGSLFVKNRGALAVGALLSVLAALLLLPQTLQAPSGLFFDMLRNDTFSLFFKALCLCATAVVVLLSMGYRGLCERSIGEFYFLLLTGTLAMLLAVSSDNLLMIYLCLEMLSLVSYFLVAFSTRDALSSEGALKYFLFGALATGIMLYGISLVYGLFGTTDLSTIVALLRLGQVDGIVATLSLVLILAGLAFKCGLAPFHMWVPDAYQGAPTAVSAFISVGPKAVGFAVLLRIFAGSFGALYSGWLTPICLVSILTMTIANAVAISQTDIKRMLGYSSIAQAGTILIGLAAGTTFGIQGVLYYLLTYAFMNLGAFGCVILISRSINSDAIEDYSGLHKKDPFSAFLLTVFLLSLAGVPPLAGFLGKFLVFASAIHSKLIVLAVTGAVNSVVAAFYYMKVIKYMYLEEPKPSAVEPVPLPLQIALTAMLAGVLLAGLYPAPFMNWIRLSVSLL